MAPKDADHIPARPGRSKPKPAKTPIIDRLIEASQNDAELIEKGTKVTGMADRDFMALLASKGRKKK